MVSILILVLVIKTLIDLKDLVQRIQDDVIDSKLGYILVVCYALVIGGCGLLEYIIWAKVQEDLCRGYMSSQKNL